MANPVKLIDILSSQTAAGHIDCEACDGTGEAIVVDPEAGYDTTECGACMGSGYNQLGLIVRGILNPPEEGYGPVELREALAAHLEKTRREQTLQEAGWLVRDAETAIAETQLLVEQAKAFLEADALGGGNPFSAASQAEEAIEKQGQSNREKRRIS